MKKRILAVDDEAPVRRLIELNLRRRGYEVTTAADGREALEQLRVDTPDLMLLDVTMPRMDGFALLEVLRNDPRMAAVPVVMLTARSRDEDFHAARRLGAELYLTKPFSPVELLQVVAQVLGVEAADMRSSPPLQKPHQCDRRSPQGPGLGSPPAGSQAPSPAPKILLVDDHPDILRLLQMALSAEGYTLLKAEDGARALELIRAERPDLVILDVVMPEVDGYRVLNRVKSDPELRHITVVMLTVRDQPHDVTLGLDIGADFYLPKPFNPAEVAMLVRRILAQRPEGPGGVPAPPA